MADAVLSWLQLASSLRWLDVGCGTGALTQAILETAEPLSVHGVDPSSGFLATAAEKISDPRFSFEVGDARELPLPRDAFDVVVAGLVLHFVPDPQKAAAEMARVTAPGGTVAAYVWDFGGEGQFTHFLWKAAIELDPTSADFDPGLRTPLGHADPMSTLFKSARLKDVIVQPVVVPIVFRDFDDYWQPHLLSGTSPTQSYVASLDAEQQTALREQLRTILPIADDGSIPLLGCLWAVRGTK